MRARRQLDQAVEHIRVAADIPAWLKPDPVMHLADGVHAGEIVRVETAGEQPAPMRGLGLFQSRDLSSDELLELRNGRHVLVEPVDDPRQFRLHRGPECREQAARIGIEPDKAHSDGSVVFV